MGRSRVSRPGGLTPLIAASLAFTSCASWVVNGADLNEGAPKAFLSRWSTEKCTLSGSGVEVAPPNEDYLLAQDSGTPVLFEIDRGQGRGSRIRNQWTDEVGQHFFSWVIGGPAWMFSFPKGPGGRAERMVFANGNYSVSDGGDGTFRPGGSPVARCPLVRAR